MAALSSRKYASTHKTNFSTTELIKYANTAFLAIKISLINTIANICQKIPSTDVTTIAKAIGMDKRINPLFLNAGLGYGGSCFPKDIKALIAFSKSPGYDPAAMSNAKTQSQRLHAKHAPTHLNR